MTKLAIHKQTCKGELVMDIDAACMTDTHRIVDVKFSHSDAAGGAHHIDVWGGTWRLSPTGETTCTVGAMDRWS
jgi:hypothetical protein